MHAHADTGVVRSIFVIEDSMALALLIRARIAERTPLDVEIFRSYAEAEAALERARPLVAVAGIYLPDAQQGQIVELLAEHDVPTILFTATLSRRIRDRFSAPNIIDYFVKDLPDTVAQVAALVDKVTTEAAEPILIVDEDPDAHKELAHLLERQNYRLVQAYSGAEALQMLAHGHGIELVVSGFHLPDMDGHELTQRIRRSHGPDRVRVIGMACSSDPYLSAAFLKAGAVDFICRPFIAEEVQWRVASNMETLEQIRHLRFLAERDPLTGLYNRRAFFERAHAAMADLRTTGAEGTIAILDIDHFKKVNDTYGHDTGDTVIKAVASVLLDVADREKLVTARFGGEEFVTLFTGMESARVHALCEELRTRIAALVIPYDGNGLSVTASLGAAIIQHEEGIDNNLNAADQMLYMAKGSGRNRVIYDAALYAA